VRAAKSNTCNHFAVYNGGDGVYVCVCVWGGGGTYDRGVNVLESRKAVAHVRAWLTPAHPRREPFARLDRDQHRVFTGNKRRAGGTWA
jgi:hypothetical protein